MMRIAISAVIFGILAGPAHAQSIQERMNERGSKAERTPLQEEQEERARRAVDVDREYERAMKRSSAAPKPVIDPWARVRPSTSGDKK